METPTWILTVSFWLHMLATVSWVGGLAVVSLIVLPVSRRSLDNEAYTRLLGAINTRLNPIGWIGLALLIVTGLIQMSANPNYLGFLAIENTWAIAILLKHITFFLIILISAYQTWSLTPALEHAALRRHRGLEDKDGEGLQRRERRLMRINLFLGVVVLLFTALARIS